MSQFSGQERERGGGDSEQREGGRTNVEEQCVVVQNVTDVFPTRWNIIECGSCQLRSPVCRGKKERERKRAHPIVDPLPPSTKKRSALAPPGRGRLPSKLDRYMHSRDKSTLVGHLVVARQDVCSNEIEELVQEREGDGRQSVCAEAK